MPHSVLAYVSDLPVSVAKSIVAFILLAIALPISLAENLTALKKWKKIIKGCPLWQGRGLQKLYFCVCVRN